MNNKNKTSKSIDQLAKDNSSSLNINAGKEKPTGISGE
jgi:hypothetical protein